MRHANTRTNNACMIIRLWLICGGGKHFRLSGALFVPCHPLVQLMYNSYEVDNTAVVYHPDTLKNYIGHAKVGGVGVTALATVSMVLPSAYKSVMSREPPRLANQIWYGSLCS